MSLNSEISKSGFVADETTGGGAGTEANSRAGFGNRKQARYAALVGGFDFNQVS